MTTTRELWTGSPAQNCPSSCHCPVPEVCRNLTPQERETETQRRTDAGFVEKHTPRNGYTAISWEKS